MPYYGIPVELERHIQSHYILTMSHLPLVFIKYQHISRWAAQIYIYINKCKFLHTQRVTNNWTRENNHIKTRDAPPHTFERFYA